MKIHNVVQGSPEWLELRAKYFTASEAPAMMNKNKSNYQTRSDLLKRKATGIAEEIDRATQALFNRGHESERATRPLAEIIVKQDLFPATGTAEIDGLPLLASFDGITMDETICWENKLWNAEFAELVSQGVVPDTHWPQLEQQLLISGADKVLFTVSDGTQENLVSGWYCSKPERRAMLIAGWKQFAEDLANYKPTEEVRPGVAAPQEALPAVSVQVTGSLAVADNLRVFGDALTQYVARMNKAPQSDDDFATLERQAKDLKAAEDALTAAENNALAQASDIDAMRRTVAQYRDIARQARLLAEKTVKAEKENRRNAIVRAGNEALQTYLTELSVSRFPLECRAVMPDVPADFGGAVKGLKTLASIQNAVDSELARAKAEASILADKIAGNLRIIEAFADHKHLLPDYAVLVQKAPEDLRAVIEQRIGAAKAREEAERDRIRAEEEARAQAQQAGIHVVEATKMVDPEPTKESAPAGQTMNLGQINAALGFTVTADFLAVLGINLVRQEKNAKLYEAVKLATICRRIQEHLAKVMQQALGGKAA